MKFKNVYIYLFKNNVFPFWDLVHEKKDKSRYNALVNYINMMDIFGLLIFFTLKIFWLIFLPVGWKQVNFNQTGSLENDSFIKGMIQTYSINRS